MVEQGQNGQFGLVGGGTTGGVDQGSGFLEVFGGVVALGAGQQVKGSLIAQVAEGADGRNPVQVRNIGDGLGQMPDEPGGIGNRIPAIGADQRISGRYAFGMVMVNKAGRFLAC